MRLPGCGGCLIGGRRIPLVWPWPGGCEGNRDRGASALCKPSRTSPAFSFRSPRLPPKGFLCRRKEFVR
jgi:hypothetical protein